MNCADNSTTKTTRKRGVNRVGGASWTPVAAVSVFADMAMVFLSVVFADEKTVAPSTGGS
ncbi:hypothetical protein GCM10022402_27450 [Salinactinospora qingdaonensis]|uniref:Uncharacterized protein n=1 Tax=Salinactinospora qingdaonensis TaxID=702744 RepID=A0ABP7FRJ2_9ACTN